MKTKVIKVGVVQITILLLIVGNGFAWDNEVTHKQLSLLASENSIIGSQNNYLNRLGLKEGMDEKFKLNEITLKAKDWLQEGAKLEDAGTNWQALTGKARFNNHFHNPLIPWDKAGLDDIIVIPNPFPPYIPVMIRSTGESALLWAQDEANQQSYSESDGLEGDQTWQMIRNYYYSALTEKTDAKRRERFARTFKGLGHQMHLIQDMSVPAHVRNDAHPEDALLGSNYITGDLYFETYAKSRVGLINDLASNPVFPQVDLTKNPGGKGPIAQFYDTRQYYETVVPTKSLTWGLSEYTNANFMSDDTIFTENSDIRDRHYFPYPRYTDQSQCYEQFEEKVDPGTSKTRTYWGKKCGGEPVDHFVTVGALFKYLPTWELQRLAISLDERTHFNYVQKLIPRAVGYSAGLLNYFFRGDIRLSYETSDTPGFVFVNKTGERVEGDFSIYYDNANSERFPLWAGKGYLESTMDDKTNTFDFIPPANPKEPGKYIVVFKGKMGNEDGAVAGYVLTRRLEITPPFQFIYSMVDGSATDPNFTRIRAKVKNASPSEQMQNGTVQAVAKYKADTNDTDFIYSVSETKADRLELECSGGG